MVPTLQLVQDPAADALLEANPLALLVGMLLDHQEMSENGGVRVLEWISSTVLAGWTDV